MSPGRPFGLTPHVGTERGHKLMEPPAGESRAKAAPTTGLTEGSPRRHFENVIRHLQIGTGDLVEHNVKRNDRIFRVAMLAGFDEFLSSTNQARVYRDHPDT